MKWVLDKSIGEIVIEFVDGKLYVEFKRSRCSSRLTKVQERDAVEISGEVKQKVSKACGKKDVSYVGVPEDVAAQIREEIEKWELEQDKKFIQDFKENGKELVFWQEVSNYDWPTMVLNKWNLGYGDREWLERLLRLLNIQEDAIVVERRIYKYCEKNDLFEIEKTIFKGWSEVECQNKKVKLTQELLNNVLNFLTDAEKQKLEKEKEEIENLLSDETRLLKRIFTDVVHITEDGYFSNHDLWCDDCFWWEYIIKPYSADEYVKKNAGAFTVKGRNGKIYTYRAPNQKVLKYLSQQYAEDVERERKKLEDRLQVINTKLVEKTGV